MTKALRVLVAAIGFGVLMGETPIEAGFLSKALLASAAGAWFALWLGWPWGERTKPSPSSLVRWGALAAGALGFGLLMGLRDVEQGRSTRGLLAGAAMTWLVVVVRPHHGKPRDVT